MAELKDLGKYHHKIILNNEEKELFKRCWSNKPLFPNLAKLSENNFVSAGFMARHNPEEASKKIGHAYDGQ